MTPEPSTPKRPRHGCLFACAAILAALTIALAAALDVKRLRESGAIELGEQTAAAEVARGEPAVFFRPTGEEKHSILVVGSIGPMRSGIAGPARAAQRREARRPISLPAPGGESSTGFRMASRRRSWSRA